MTKSGQQRNNVNSLSMHLENEIEGFQFSVVLTYHRGLFSCELFASEVLQDS